MAKVRALHELASARGCSLAQFAVLWLWRRPEITSVLVGASRVRQFEELHEALALPPLSAGELVQVEAILTGGR